MTDYSQFYDLESHLFTTVGPRFHREGYLSAFDFFCVITWKANRAISRVAKRLVPDALRTGDALERAVASLTSCLYKLPDGESRMCLLLKECGFRLPMASAILTVLYPDEFTVYDWRVCDAIGFGHDLADRSSFIVLWKGYSEFKAHVEEAAPKEMTLRQKDKYLWGKSFCADLEKKLTTGFSPSVKKE
jgi:hypothetical protein